MNTYRLVLIGFGNVGQGLAQIIRDHGAALTERFGLHLQIVAVCDLLKGSIYNPQGIDAGELLDVVARTGHVNDIAAPKKGWDALETIRRADADVVVELSYTDLESGEPAQYSGDRGCNTHLRPRYSTPVAGPAHSLRPTR